MRDHILEPVKAIDLFAAMRVAMEMLQTRSTLKESMIDDAVGAPSAGTDRVLIGKLAMVFADFGSTIRGDNQDIPRHG
jgi:hypothetical protein